MNEQERRELESLRRLQIRLQKFSDRLAPTDFFGVLADLAALKELIREGK